MKVYKSRGIIYSQTFVDLLNYRLSDNENIGATIEAFNNCREQGYIIRVHHDDARRNDLEKGLTFFVYNNRWSDEPAITWEDKEMFDTIYSEEAWSERTETKEHVEDIVDIAIDLIERKMIKERD